VGKLGMCDSDHGGNREVPCRPNEMRRETRGATDVNHGLSDHRSG
jgi:hypothetical protein